MKNGIAKILFLLFLSSIFVEIFVFNIRCFQSMSYKETPVSDSNVLEIEGGHMLENGDLELDEGSDHLELMVGNMNIPLRNVRLDIEVIDEAVSMWHEDNVCFVEVFVWDESLHEYFGDDGLTYLASGLYKNADKKVLKNIESSQYIWTETYGDVKELGIDIYSSSGRGRVFRINNIVFNARQNMHISVFRLAVIFLTITILYIFMFEKHVWDADCITPAGWKVKIPMLLLVFVAVVSFWWSMSNQQLRNNLPNEYAQLARAFLQGRTYVDEGGEFAKEYSGKMVFWSPLSNEIKFDYSYYDGKYYVYFGVLPCIVFFCHTCCSQERIFQIIFLLSSFV